VAVSSTSRPGNQRAPSAAKAKPKPAGPPAWRRVFNRAERAVGAPLEDFVGSRRAIDGAVSVMKVQRAMAGALRGVVDRELAGLLHFVNMPTRTDVRRLSRQLTALTGEVRMLADHIDELQRTLPPARESLLAEVRVLAVRLDELQRSLPPAREELTGEVRALAGRVDELQRSLSEPRAAELGAGSPEP
jgi:predicted RNase H-like nuclease (RuvC/YqgF family)